jgi:hypothetical protein
LLAAPVAAQDGWASRDHDYARSTMNHFVDRFQRNLVDPVARGVRSTRASSRPSVSATVPVSAATAVAPRRPSAPRLMAAAYPEARRAEVERTFVQLLGSFESIERQFGLPRYDVAAAAAAFVAGSHMGYRHTGFPDRHFSALVDQMRTLLSADAGFRHASAGAKQDMYEHLAILGMLMAGTQMSLARRPDAAAEAAMREAAQQYLEAFLKTDAERVQIGAHGLGLR